MRDARLLRHCLLLSLPTAALVVFSAYFLLASVPRIAATEHARAEEESKKFAEGLKKGEVERDFTWEYGKGMVGEAPDWALSRYPATMTWKDWSLRGGKRKTGAWGWHGIRLKAHASPVRMVWVRDERFVHAAIFGIEEVDYAFWLWMTIPLLMAALVVATASAVFSLVSYAKTRDDFLAAAVHDLTTPLVGMRFLIGSDAEEARNMNERMLRLVENIREFLSLGGRRKTPAKKTFRIGDAFAAAYKIFAADYAEEVSGPVKVSGNGSLEVCADLELTTQVLWNLLGNDLKYAAPYGAVSVRFGAADGFVSVELADEGQGMTPRQMRHAFDRYWRARTALMSGKGGFGIGLCASLEYARAMGGNLAVGPNSPHGCIFTLTLPMPRTC